MEINKINILMAINKSYLEQMKTVICSLGINCSLPVDIYVMHNELEEKDIMQLKALVQEMCKGDLYEIKIDKDFLKNAKINNHFSVEMYYRIFAPIFIPANIHRILWLDADLIVLRDLKEFYQYDLQGKSIAACSHRERNRKNPVINMEGIERLNLGEEGIYFNSGVLLMDLDKIRKNFDGEHIIKLIYENEDILINPDQDILNIIYQKDKIILDWKKYNFQIHYDWLYQNERDYLKKEAIIIHYVGPCKPWKYNTSHFSYKYYWKYYFLHGKKIQFFKVKIMYILYRVCTKFTIERKK